MEVYAHKVQEYSQKEQQQISDRNVNMEYNSKKRLCTLILLGFADLRLLAMTQLYLSTPQLLTGGQQ